jgi:hypothetical protein
MGQLVPLRHGAGIIGRALTATVAREAFYSCGYLFAVPQLRARIASSSNARVAELRDKAPNAVWAGSAISAGLAVGGEVAHIRRGESSRH